MKLVSFLLLFFIFNPICFASIDFENFSPNLLTLQEIQSIKGKALLGDKDYQYALALIHYSNQSNLYAILLYSSDSHNPASIADYKNQIQKQTEEWLYWIEKSANQNHILALLNLAVYKKKAQEIDQMIFLLEKAFAQGSLRAAILLRTHYQESNDEKYLEWILKASWLGDSASQTKLIDIYSGKTMDYVDYADHEKALYWTHKIANDNHLYAQLQLALMYVDGVKTENGVVILSPNYLQAIVWAEKMITIIERSLKQLSYQQHQQSYTAVQQFQQMTLTNSYRQTLKQAKQVTQKSQYKLAQNYYQGLSVEQDYKEAFRFFYRAARQRHLPSLYHLALMYFEGQGVTQDYKEAAKYFYEVATSRTKNNDELISSAAYHLHILYKEGQGVSQDLDQASKWLALTSQKPLLNTSSY